MRRLWHIVAGLVFIAALVLAFAKVGPLAGQWILDRGWIWGS